ncbi:hypothetical protein JXQ31_13940 [candidate division KSB1 bacterium]|nr:hypothetical protein [candidate division KSB1 bacterium]
MTLFTDKKNNVSIILLLLILINYAGAEVKFSGDVTGVTTYVYRGIKQYTGPAMQGTAGFSYGALSFGLWCSSVVYYDDTEVESDPYIELFLPTGSVATSVGVIISTLDLFESFNDDANYEYEVFAKAGSGAFGLAAFFVPSQSSTKNNINESDYWVEVSGETAFKGADLTLTLGYGTYSSKWLAEPKKDAVSCVVLTAGKPISEVLSVSWNYSIGLDDAMENILWMSFTYGFL